MNKWTGVWFKDTQRGCLTYLLSVGIGLPLACCLLVIPLCLVSELAASASGDGNPLLILLACLGPLFLLMMGGIAGAIYFVIYRRHQRLAAVFSPLGLEGRSYALTGHQFHGRMRGRQVDVYISRGPNLLFYVESEAATRLAAVFQDEVVPGLARLFNKQPLTHNGAALQGLTIFSHDQAWGQVFAANEFVQSALPRLLRGEHDFVFRKFHVRPDAAYLNLYRTQKMFAFDLRAEQVSEWLDLLLELAETVERLPAPAEKLTASPLEIRLRKGDGK